MFFSVMTKLLVGLGRTDNGLTDDIEIIDLKSTSTNRTIQANFPMKLWESFGGLGFHNKPMICGGYPSNKCFSLDGNEWKDSPSMNTTKGFEAVSPSPYPTKCQKFFVTGGPGNTAEVLTEQGWETLPQLLPITIHSHCSVLVNSTTVMVIGGSQNDSTSSNTYLFNTEFEIWVKGPQLKTKRVLHSCGRIRKNSQSQDFSIIVAGGFDYDASNLPSVEILDLDSKEWRKGPDLPFGIYEAQMVEDQSGGVILVGGFTNSNVFLDTLYQLPHGGADAEWTKIEQKLNIGRWGHVAFLVPDNIVACS